MQCNAMPTNKTRIHVKEFDSESELPTEAL